MEACCRMFRTGQPRARVMPPLRQVRCRTRPAGVPPRPVRL